MAREYPFNLLAAWQLKERISAKAFGFTIKGAFAAWGEGTSVRKPFRVTGAHAISFGAHVYVGEGSWFQTVDSGCIEIGNECHFAGYAAISAALSIVFEPHVCVGRNVQIFDHIHRYDLDLPIDQQGITDLRPVRIGMGAWLGTNVVILPGVSVGRQAVVGANSVVRSDVPARAVVAGLPAGPIRAQVDDGIRPEVDGRMGRPVELLGIRK